MKGKKCLIVLLAALCVGLSACRQVSAQQMQPDKEEQPVATESAPPVTAPQETEPPVTEPAVQVPVAEFPETDRATGTLCFYIDGKPVYSGGMVSSIVEAGAVFEDDLTVSLDPRHSSKTLRAHFADENGKIKYLYVVAINWTDEACPISKCSIYSLAVNCQDGISFGSGRGAEPFVTGVTTSEQLLETYGEPNYHNTGKDFEEIAYYEPFSCAYFICRDGVVEQINAHYGAHVLQKPAAEMECKYTESDSWMLMSRYLDITPYLKGKQEIVSELTNLIQLGEDTVELGKLCKELPEQWYKDLAKMRTDLASRYYMTVGKVGKPNFTLLNTQAGTVKGFGATVIKGVRSNNPGYHNWGQDFSAYPAFSYQGITQDSSIPEVLEQLGAPCDILCTGNGRTCFAWMQYENDSGITCKIMVDPALNQVVEIRLDQHFKNEVSYT